MSYNHLKVKLRLFLTGRTVAMVICYVEKMTITCSQLFRHVYDTIIVLSSDKEWLN